MTPDEQHATWKAIMRNWQAIINNLEAMDVLLGQVGARKVANQLLDLSGQWSVALVYAAPPDLIPRPPSP